MITLNENFFPLLTAIIEQAKFTKLEQDRLNKFVDRISCTEFTRPDRVVPHIISLGNKLFTIKMRKHHPNFFQQLNGLIQQQGTPIPKPAPAPKQDEIIDLTHNTKPEKQKVEQPIHSFTVTKDMPISPPIDLELLAEEYKGNAGFSEYYTQLRQAGFKWIKILGDGHCGFRALATWLIRNKHLVNINLAFDIIRSSPYIQKYRTHTSLIKLEKEVEASIAHAAETRNFTADKQLKLIEFLRLLSAALITNIKEGDFPVNELMDGKDPDTFVKDTLRMDGDGRGYAKATHLDQLCQFLTSQHCHFVDANTCANPLHSATQAVQNYLNSKDPKQAILRLKGAAEALERSNKIYTPISIHLKTITEKTTPQERAEIFAEAEKTLYLIENLEAILKDVQTVPQEQPNDAQTNGMIFEILKALIQLKEKINANLQPMIDSISAASQSRIENSNDFAKFKKILHAIKQVTEVVGTQPILFTHTEQAQMFKNHLDDLEQRNRIRLVTQSIAQLLDLPPNTCMLLRRSEHYELLVCEHNL